MDVIAIDHLIVAAPDLQSATEPWRRLGLVPLRGTSHPGHGTENAVVFFGSDPETMFYLEFLAVTDREAAADTARGRKLLEAIDAGGGAFRAVLEVADAEAARNALDRSPLAYEVAHIAREDGSAIGQVISLRGEEETSADPRFIHYITPREDRFASRQARGLFASTFELARLDHLAVVPRDLEGDTRLWGTVFGVEVTGEIEGGGILVRQLAVGDAVIEFLGPLGPRSRLAGASPGLRAMIAMEVDDLAAAVATARERGFTVSPPAAGILPGTRTATIGADQLAGVALQMLEYA